MYLSGINLSGRRIEAVTSHDLNARCVKHLNGSIVTGLGLTADSGDNVALVDRRGGNVDEVSEQGYVVELS